jgi:hypothetical protein
MARKAGLDYLSRRFGQRRVARLLKYFKRWGTGALDYPLRTFIVVVALGRAGRYGAIAAIAFHYGRRFVVGLRHLGQHSGWLLTIAAAVVFVVTVAIVLKKRLESSRLMVKTHET